MTLSASLFEPPARPIIEPASMWMTNVLSGSVATSLCVIAIAALGMLMLSGRLPLRRGAQVVLGCFVLLGASTFASGLLAFGDAVGGAQPIQAGLEPSGPDDPEQPLPPANYDPYARASLRPE